MPERIQRQRKPQCEERLREWPPNSGNRLPFTLRCRRVSGHSYRHRSQRIYGGDGSVTWHEWITRRGRGAA